MIERFSTRWRRWRHVLCGRGVAHYTSLERDGALAEIGYRLLLEPIWPSRIQHDLHKISIRTEKTLHFADVAALQPLGVDPTKYPGFDYAATQAIAAAAHFLGFDGLIVPSARAPCRNLVLFVEEVSETGHLEVLETSPVEWAAWRKNKTRPRVG